MGDSPPLLWVLSSRNPMASENVLLIFVEYLFDVNSLAGVSITGGFIIDLNVNDLRTISVA